MATTRIGHLLWADYTAGSNLDLLIGSTAEAAAVAVTVQRADLPNLLGVLGVAGYYDPDNVLKSGVPSRLDKLEARIEEFFSGRISNLSYRTTSLEDEVAKMRRELEQAYERGGDAKAVVEEARSLTARISVLEGSMVSLATVIQASQDDMDELQQVLARPMAAPAAPAIPADVATKDYVDAAVKRINGALREHITRVFQQALRAAAPGPGIIRRVLDALRPSAPPTWVPAQVDAQAFRVPGYGIGLDPDKLAAVGAAAARERAGTP